MSKLANLCFDFSVLSHQGAYFSSYTPLRIQDYLRPAFLPHNSAYHLVGCHHPQLMTRCDVGSVLTAYLNASQKANNKMVIDLCLPFFDESSKRTFLGRYIIFKGELMGVRLSTNVNGIAPQFSPWPRHRAKMASVKTLANTQNILIGQIAIYLTNLRVGLLFECEVHTSAQEYLNCGFDVIALCYDRREHDASMLGIKENLSREVVLLEGGDGQQWGNEVNCMLYGSKREDRKKSKVYIEYYAFQKIFSNKRTIYLSERQQNFITPLSIDFSLLQQRTILYPLPSMYYQLIPQAYSISIPTYESPTDKYLHRLYNFHQRGQFKKIVVILEDSPHVICFLVMLQMVLKEMQKQEILPLRKIFKFIDLSNTKLCTVLSRFKMLKFQQPKKRDQRKDNTNTTTLIKTLDFLTENQKRQTFFPIITGEKQTINVLRMLNQRERLKIEQGEGFGQVDAAGEMLQDNNASCQCLNDLPLFLKTWIATPFFTKEELKQLYFSSTVRQMIGDEQWHLKVWQRYKRIQGDEDNEEDDGIGLIEENSIYESVMIEDFLQKNCPLMHDFQYHYAKVQVAGVKESKETIFSHFLFRRLTVVPVQSSSSMLQQLLITSQSALLSTYLFMHSHSPSLSQRLSPRLALNSLAIARQQAKEKRTCHICSGFYLPQLLFKCKMQMCGQYFCFQCLIRMRIYDEKSLAKNSWQVAKNIKMCPICRGLCSDCQRCEEKRTWLAEQRQQGDQSLNSSSSSNECHYCHKESSLFHFTCSVQTCGLTFCLSCVEEYYRPRGKEHEEAGWACFVCQHRCYCNYCEHQKRTIMAMKMKENVGADQMRKGILKNANRREDEMIGQQMEEIMLREEESDDDSVTCLNKPKTFFSMRANAMNSNTSINKLS